MHTVLLRDSDVGKSSHASSPNRMRFEKTLESWLWMALKLGPGLFVVANHDAIHASTKLIGRERHVQSKIRELRK